MQGNRILNGIGKEIGDYWKVEEEGEHRQISHEAGTLEGKVTGEWRFIAPDGRPGTLALNHVEEHEDGTISVLPTDEYPDNFASSQGKGGWTGTINHGVFE